MGKTRRKLYGKSQRRLRGGVKLGTLCKGAIITAVLAMDPAQAKTATFRELVTDYVNIGGWKESKALGEYLADPTNYFPTSFPSGLFTQSESGVEATSCGLPPDVKTESDASRVLESYLLRSGETYRFIPKNAPSEAKDVYILEHVYPGKWETEPSISPGDWDNYIVEGPLPHSKDEDDEPEGGKKKRRGQRKTLRRKK